MGISRIAVSVQQPWAWFIVNGFKKVENRIWSLPDGQSPREAKRPG
mgnify:CR=1 FL=1